MMTVERWFALVVATISYPGILIAGRPWHFVALTACLAVMAFYEAIVWALTWPVRRWAGITESRREFVAKVRADEWRRKYRMSDREHPNRPSPTRRRSPANVGLAGELIAPGESLEISNDTDRPCWLVVVWGEGPAGRDHAEREGPDS